jgi:trigger factor
MLPDFETGVRGARAGEERTFPVAFPADYGSAELAGKTAQFKVTVKAVEQPSLPALDAAFATQLGVADGDLAKTARRRPRQSRARSRAAAAPAPRRR